MLSGAGFGATSEALYLRKKLLVIPMKGQYEQHCNAAALNSIGVPSMKSLKKKHLHHVSEWIENGKVVEVDYPDNTDEITDLILNDYKRNIDSPLKYSWGKNEMRAATGIEL
jgi:UDP:flavonoid glycosyltransferase YjiC (YdhE family)